MIDDDLESGDLSTSAFSQEGSGESPAEVDEGQPNHASKIAVQENKAVGRSRFIMLLVLSCAAVGAAVISFVFTVKAEEDDFEAGFRSVVSEVDAVINQNADNMIRAFRQFSVAVTSYAVKTDSTFPMVTIPDFERRVDALKTKDKHDTSGPISVTFLPVVRDMNERILYEQYAFLNAPEANKESQIVTGMEPNTGEYVPFIFQFVGEGDNSTILPSGPDGPWIPLYQTSPTLPSAFFINWDTAVYPWNMRDLMVMDETKSAVMTEIFDLTSLLSEEDQTNHPTSVFNEPIMTNFSTNAKVGGMLQAILSWDIFFKNLLPDGTPSVYAVVRNTCNQSFTYEIIGSEAFYLGEGNLYRFSDHVDLKKTIILEAFHPKDELNLDLCAYSVDLYPTNSMEESYQTNARFLIAGIILLTFFFTTITIAVYDLTVKRRQEKVMQSHTKTERIIDSFFPSQFRERLFEEDSDSKGEGNGDWRANKANVEIKNINSTGKQDLPTHEDIPELSMKKPVAEYYDSTTIMMADIHGFTAWSSVREPSQVFMLLETIYGAFDTLAQRRHVFKVETVGDCYVAVAGLPTPRKDHACVMARYAHDCLTKMSQVVHKLEVVLGPGTSTLGIRIGLHSGPTIAGVLRGEKARFQLFGDTINTASRIETTGTPNRIHISHTTADELTKAGKRHWVTQREDLVFAKGKGEIQTYWLQAHHSGSTARTPGSLEHPEQTEKVPLTEYSIEKADPPRSQASRVAETAGLVKFSVSLLLPHLEQITALRVAQGSSPTPSVDSSSKLTEVASIIGQPGGALDQIKDIIDLPQVLAAKINSADAVLSNNVKEQLRSYLSQISLIYRANSFHNFEHAVSVAQSASKLLSRIVAPGVVNILTGEKQHDLKGDQELHDHTLGLASAPLTQFAIIFSALIHDVDHRGVPNDQLETEEPSLALLYSQSIAEQNSIDIAWRLLMDDQFKELRSSIYSNEEELRHFRSILVNSTMATDIFEKSLAKARKNRWDAAFAEQSPGVESRNRKATIVIEHIIQASDVAHCMQHWHIYKKWNEKLFAERAEAFRKGRADQNPTEGWYEGELWFFDNYVIPLANKLESCGVFGVSCVEFMSYAKQNRVEWEKTGKVVVSELSKKYCS